GRSIARRTRSGTFVGPGICRKCRPELMSRSLYVQSRRRWLCRSPVQGEGGCRRASPCPSRVTESVSLMKLDAAVEQCSTVGIAVAQDQAESADTRKAVNSDGRERDRVPVVGAVAEQGHAVGRVIEDGRQDLGRLEVHVRRGILGMHVLDVEVLAPILVHREARLAVALRVDVALAVRLVARWRRAVLD